MPGLLVLLDGRSTLSVLVLATIVLLTGLGATLHLVARNERLVVTRRGEVRRVLGPGIVAAVPGRSHLTRVSLDPAELAVVARATTVDRVRLTVLATARYRVVDAGSTVLSGPNGAVDAAGEAIEQALTKVLSSFRLAAIPSSPHLLERQLPQQVTALTSQWGVEVDSVRVTGVETQVNSILLDAARRSG